MIGALGQPVHGSLTARLWRAAAVGAGLRVAVNDERRADDRNRGRERNMLNDLQGVLAELLLIRAASQSAPGMPLPHELINLYGHSEQVDVTMAGATGVVRLEAKSLLMEENRRYFLINDRAHANSRKHGADAYVGFVTVLGGGIAVRSGHIPLTVVDTWPVRTLGQHTDPARYLTFTEFADRHLGLTSDAASELRGRLLKDRESVIGADDLRQASELAYGRLALLRQSGFVMSQDPDQLVDQLLGIVN